VRGAGQAPVGVAWTGMGWLAGLCVAAGRGPALDLACVCAPARGPQLVGVRGRGRVALLALAVWPCLPSRDCAVWSGRGLGLGSGCVIDVEWMLHVRSVLAACVVRVAHRSFAQADIS